MNDLILFREAKYRICGDGVCLLYSLEKNDSNFQVPSAVLSDDGKKYIIIGIHEYFQYNNVNSLSFDESSEIMQIYSSVIRQCKSIFNLPPKIKIIQSSVNCSLIFKGSPKIISEKKGEMFVSTAGSRVIANNYPYEIVYQQSFRQKYFIRETTRLVGAHSFYYNRNVRYVVIPSSVEFIGHSSFQNCANLQSISFKKNSKLKRIGDYSFSCSAIESISIPSNVEEIGTSAFGDCKHLRSVTFSDDSNLKIIGDSCFCHVDIESIDISASVGKIGVHSFSGCFNLRSITFSKGSKLKIIGSYCFCSTNIESIEIPSSVERIGNGAFYDCKNCYSVKFQNESKRRGFGSSIFESL